MTISDIKAATGNTIENALSRYHKGCLAAADTIVGKALSFPIPEPNDIIRRYYAVSDISFHELGELGGRRVIGLNLMRNAGTRTTKTFASLSIVARAAEHVRRTGERIIIITPTSGNKGTALRDAVARAYATGVATPASLRIVTVLPMSSRNKLRRCSDLAAEELRQINPVAFVAGGAAEVKELARRTADQFAADRTLRGGWRIWYTLDLDNYRVADAVRAFAEAEYAPITANSPPRWHVHAVSSAYGLLGYHLGHSVLSGGKVLGLPGPAAHPGFLLVQHLATPDMVLSLATGSFSRAGVPNYRWDPIAAAWRQDSDPRFPAITASPQEEIDSTFYTSMPPTSAAMDDLVALHGGGGIVVSRRECYDRYAQIRDFAAPFGADVPEDPAKLREWSLVMALCGVLIAHERSLLPMDTDVVVHASGCYTDDNLPPMPPGHAVLVNGDEDLHGVILRALRLCRACQTAALHEGEACIVPCSSQKFTVPG